MQLALTLERGGGGTAAALPLLRRHRTPVPVIPPLCEGGVSSGPRCSILLAHRQEQFTPPYSVLISTTYFQEIEQLSNNFLLTYPTEIV